MRRGRVGGVQNGFHGVMGLLTGPPLARRLNLSPGPRRAFLAAFTLGNLLPDLDWALVAAAWFLDPQHAPGLHRSFSHSLFAALMLWAGTGLAARMGRDRELAATGLGLGLGVVGHILLDLLGWFSGDLLWPLGFFGLPSYVSFWSWFHLPPLLGRILAALEYLAFTLYYYYLEGLSRQSGRGIRLLPAMGRLRRWMTGLTALILLLSVPLPDPWFNTLHYSIWAAAAYPAALYYTIRLGGAIGWAGSPGQQKGRA